MQQEPRPDGVKVPVIVRPEYVVYIEQQQVPFLHCDVLSWSSLIRRAYRRDLDALFALHGGPWFALNPEPGADKRAKFLQLSGFHFFGEREGYVFFRRA
jgi:hypothetical protein